MSFSGSRAWIVSSVGLPAVGKFEVWVDGVLNATVDCYGPAVVQGLRLWDSGTLTSGTHTVQIKLTGTKNALSSDVKIGFDALLVDHSA